MSKLRWVYDIETYPNIFTCTVMREDYKFVRCYEISDRKNQSQELLVALRWFKEKRIELVGFNNTGFDYPVVHEMLMIANSYYQVHKTIEGFEWPVEITYQLAQKQIDSFNGPFGHTIKESEMVFPQVDLFKIHHFDNVAKSTSLKMLQFNMRSDSIEDLPYPVGTSLTDEQKDVLIKYNLHDVHETCKFYHHSKGAIQFREKLSQSLGFNVMNFNDTKIGKEYFAKKLEAAKPGVCYEYIQGRGRKIRQTKREYIDIKDVLFNYYDFKRPEFIAVLKWFKELRITETKGVLSDIEEDDLGDVAKYAVLEPKRKKFSSVPTDDDIAKFKKQRPMGWVNKQELKAKRKGEILYSHWMNWRVANTLNVVVDGFRFDFGTGGIHGSVPACIVREDEDYEIIDADVSSMYPNIAISNRVYPEHLSELFCVIYEDVYKQRQSYPKGSAENGVMKLALNGVYGDSNNKFSPFFDPAYTMAITINGQLSLCLLSERLMQIPNLKVIQVNTDGVTVRLPREYRNLYNEICEKWQKDVKLQLEFAYYKTMYIRDVNNYLAVYTNGKVKRKGAYQYEDLGWHQNHSALVVPKAVEAVALHGVDLEKFIKYHSDDYDFMLRTKVDRSSKLVMEYEDLIVQQQRICRYYACKSGGYLFKIMKPLAGKTEDRKMGIDIGWKVKVANKLEEFDRLEVDYSYYITQAKKLLIEDEFEDLSQTDNQESE